jgi:hypothetical protein
MAYIHISEVKARRSVCAQCVHNAGSSCGLSKVDHKHNVLVGVCPDDRWPKNFKPPVYLGKDPENPIQPRVYYTRAKQEPATAQGSPALSQQISNFAGSMKGWAKDRFRVVSPQVHEERLAVCRSCPFFDSSGWGGAGKCTKCGCAVPAKTKLRSEKCPAGKW